MDLDVPSSKFKILFINVFTILYKAATLNPYRLGLDLREIKNVVHKSSDVPLLPHILILLISLLLIAKFLFGYISLAANVVAIFPILSEEQPELLLPTIFSQAVENIMLSAIEIMLGYITVKYYIPHKSSLLVIFITKMMIKISFSISTLNIYSDLYTQIKLNMPHHAQELTYTEGDGDPNEEFVTKQSLM